MATDSRLSSKSETVLELIALGHTYDQILTLYPKLTYLDIFNAAQEALQVAGQVASSYADRIAEVHKAYPRAYEPWSAEEEERLIQLVRSGNGVDGVAAQLHRQPSAIRSRMRKLNLADESGRYYNEDKQGEPDVESH